MCRYHLVTDDSVYRHMYVNHVFITSDIISETWKLMFILSFSLSDESPFILPIENNSHMDFFPVSNRSVKHYYRLLVCYSSAYWHLKANRCIVNRLNWTNMFTGLCCCIE